MAHRTRISLLDPFLWMLLLLGALLVAWISAPDEPRTHVTAGSEAAPVADGDVTPLALPARKR